MKLLYAPQVKEVIARLPPEIKKEIKALIEGLREDPYGGKPLQRELTGFHTLRFKRYRIIYKIFLEERFLRIYSIAPRKNVYEDFLKSNPFKTPPII